MPKPEYAPPAPMGFEDVCDALADAKACARDALKALEQADLALGSDDFGRILIGLRDALEELENAREATQKCIAPVDGWDEQSQMNAY